MHTPYRETSKREPDFKVRYRFYSFFMAGTEVRSDPDGRLLLGVLAKDCYPGPRDAFGQPVRFVAGSEVRFGDADRDRDPPAPKGR